MSLQSRPVPAPGHFPQSKFKIAQALPYRNVYRASFFTVKSTRLLHRRSRHRRAGDCSGSSSMHHRRPPYPPLPPTALRYPGLFCRLFCCLCSHAASFRASELEIGRQPRPDREAEAVGIVLKVASVQWQPRRTRIERARSRRPTPVSAGRTDSIRRYR